MTKPRIPNPVNQRGGGSIKAMANSDPDPLLYDAMGFLNAAVPVPLAGLGWAKVAWLDDEYLRQAISTNNYRLEHGDCRNYEYVERLSRQLVKAKGELRKYRKTYPDAKLVADLPLRTLVKIAQVA